MMSHPAVKLARMKKVDVAMWELAASQHQIVTREDFLVHGTVDQLRQRVRTGRYIREYEGVYSMAGSPGSFLQALYAAVATGAPSAAGSFRAAAYLQGLPGGQELVEVTYLRHKRIVDERIVSHESVYLDERDLTVVHNIQVTRVERTLCDLAGLVELQQLDEATVELAVLEAMRRNSVDLESLSRQHERLAATYRLGGVVMRKILDRLVAPIRPTESRPETKMLMMLRDAGFPEPVPQYWLTLPNGERIRLDFAWPWIKAGVEWDPYLYHGDRARYGKMAQRTRLLRQMEWERVCVDDADFDNGMPESIAALHQIFDEKGRL